MIDLNKNVMGISRPDGRFLRAESRERIKSDGTGFPKWDDQFFEAEPAGSNNCFHIKSKKYGTYISNSRLGGISSMVNDWKNGDTVILAGLKDKICFIYK